MKKYILLIIILFCFGCQNQPELNGKWVILKMIHKGTEIYPQTVSDKIKVTFNVAGYEGAEKIDFKTSDSTAIFPGFKSDELKVEFKKNENTLIFSLLNDDLYESKDYDFAKEVYLQDLELITYRKDVIELKSDLTLIQLINERKLMDQRLNNLFN